MNEHIDTTEPLLKIKEVAEFLQVSETTVKRMGKDGRLKPIIINDRGYRRYLKSDVVKFVGKHE